VDVKDNGLEARIADTDLVAFIRRSDLSRERSEQRPERFAVGQKVDAKITQFDKKTRKITASIKALEIAEEKEAVAQYGSLDSGASLGDILGAALNKAQKGDAANEMAEKAGKAADKDEKPAKAAGKAKRAAADETEEPAAKDE
jgi:small subunit ribosomal protein S1